MSGMDRMIRQRLLDNHWSRRHHSKSFSVHRSSDESLRSYPIFYSKYIFICHWSFQWLFSFLPIIRGVSYSLGLSIEIWCDKMLDVLSTDFVISWSEIIDVTKEDKIDSSKLDILLIWHKFNFKHKIYSSFIVELHDWHSHRTHLSINYHLSCNIYYDFSKHINKSLVDVTTVVFVILYFRSKVKKKLVKNNCINQLNWRKKQIDIIQKSNELSTTCSKISVLEKHTHETQWIPGVPPPAPPPPDD